MAAVRPRVAAIIPTLNEEDAIAAVIAAIPVGAVDRVIVVDSGSSDGTVARARRAGAEVISEILRGYGRACRAGAEAAVDCEILIFLDGDGADCPELIPALIAPVAKNRADFVIGSRTRGLREPGSMSVHQLLAGYAIGTALGLLYGVRYTDMGPMRAIRRDLLLSFDMVEMTYGWNLEMQMRAARAGLRVIELPVSYRHRVGGVSKVSGNLSGSLKASGRILLTFMRIAFEAPHATRATAPVRR